MQQFSGDGIRQPIFQNRRLVLAAKIHLKKSVMSALRTENRVHLLGVHRKSDGLALASVQHGRNFAGLAEPPRLVFAARAAGRTFHYNFFRFFCLLCHVLLPFLNARWDKHSCLSARLSCNSSEDGQECLSYKIR